MVIYVTYLLCQQFRDLNIINCAINQHMRKKYHLTYTRAARRFVARDDDTTISQRYEAISASMALGINFFSECVFVDEAGFDRNMHCSHGWFNIGKAWKITVEPKRSNLSILGAITAHGVITLSRREVCAPTNEKRKTDDGPAPKKGTTGSGFMEFIEQVLTNIEAHDLLYQYLVMYNTAIHRTSDVKNWVTERGFEIVYFLKPNRGILVET